MYSDVTWEISFEMPLALGKEVPWLVVGFSSLVVGFRVFSSWFLEYIAIELSNSKFALLGFWGALTGLCFFHPMQIKYCSMHSLNLGYALWVAGGAITNFAMMSKFGVGMNEIKLIVSWMLGWISRIGRRQIASSTLTSFKANLWNKRRKTLQEKHFIFPHLW